MKLHNLLDNATKKSLIREYYSRLAVVAALLFALAMFAGSVALLPTYAYLTAELQVSGGELAHVNTDTATSSAARDTLKRSAAELALFKSAFDEVPMSALVRDAFGARPEGVVVTGVSYNRETRTLTIAGVAKDRSALVTYSRNLEAHERFSSVQLPISDLAKNVDLPFRISFIAETGAVQ